MEGHTVLHTADVVSAIGNAEIKDTPNKGSSLLGALAPELLSRIFKAVADEEHALYDLGWVRLMLVCRYFREVGVAHCELWSYHAIPNPAARTLPPQSALGFYMARVERAKGWPLSVRLQYDRKTAELLQSPGSPFWDALTGNLKALSVELPRTRARVIGGTNWDSQSAVHAFLDRFAVVKHSGLQDLHLQATKNAQAYDHEVSRILSGSTMRTLSLGLIPRKVAMDLPFLTDLTLSLPSLDDIVVALSDLLKLCPALVTLRVIEVNGFYRHTRDLPYPPLKIALPNLRSISYHGDVTVLNALLDCCTLSSSEHLSLNLVGMEPATGPTQLASNLRTYFLSSPPAIAGDWTLYTYANRFYISSRRDGVQADVAVIVAGDQHVNPELDLDDMAGILLPVILSAAPLACIDTRFKSVHRRVSRFIDEQPTMPSIPFAIDNAVLVIEPGNPAHLVLDILRALLLASDVRTRVTGICIDLARLRGKEFDAEYVSETFDSLCAYLRELKAVRKALANVEVLHADVLEGQDGILRLDTMLGLVTSAVIVDGVAHLAT
ncbi:unnamed protein product [Peniophora sp. CBMAI 1063]|nr:unnamed protein product [Peniophora sp. CBMAI 1063]